MLAIINYAELPCQAVYARFEITAVDWPCRPPADAVEQLNYKTKWYKIVDTKQAVLCY